MSIPDATPLPDDAREALTSYQDLPADTYAAGRCTKCRGWIVAKSAAAWSRAVKNPCPHCGIRGW